MTNTEEAAAIFVRIFEALARQAGKTLSQSTREDMRRACELLGTAGEELDDMFEDLPPRQSPAEQAIDPRFAAWRDARRAP